MAKVAAADRAGYDSVWISEDPDGWDAFALMGAIATATERIRIGPGVVSPLARHPNLIAASVATVDRLSGGRAFVGLGRGQPEWFERVFDLPAGAPLERLETTIALLRTWWRPPFRASARGAIVVRDWERSVAPIQPPPGPPIYVAATGQRALRLAGRVADGVRFNLLASAGFLAGAVAEARAAAPNAAARDRLRFVADQGVAVVAATSEIEAILERTKVTVAMIHTLPGMSRQLQVPGIDVDAVMEEVRFHMRTNEILSAGGGFPALRRGGDLTAAKRAIPLELMAEVAIVGTAPQVRVRLEAMTALGVTDAVIDPDRIAGKDDDLEAALAAIVPGVTTPHSPSSDGETIPT